MTKYQLFRWALTLFIAGAGFRSFVAVPLVVAWLVFVGGVTGMVFGIGEGRRHFWAGALLALACVGGVVRMEYAIGARPDLGIWYGHNLMIQGVAIDDPKFTDRSQRFIFEARMLDERALARRFFVLVTSRPYPAYKFGDELALEGVLERPENFSAFDYVAYLARDDIFSVMAFPKIEKIGEGKGNQVYLLLARIKHSFENRIDAALAEPHSAFLKGLLLGERESLPQNVAENFQKTGTSHIVALSGYNITLVGTYLMNFLLFLTLPFRWTVWISSGAIVGFVVMTGASASVVRAGVMGLLLLASQRMGRMYHMTNALLFAGALMVLHNPKILRFDTGFQLSFLATLGLMYCAPAIQRSYENVRWRVTAAYRVWRERASDTPSYRTGRIIDIRLIPPERILIETLSAQAMVLPLLVYLFGTISLVSPVVNVLVLMVVPSAMGAGFLAGLAGYAWEPLGRILGWIAWLIIEYVLTVIEFFAGLPGASVTLPAFSGALVVLLYTLILFILIRRSLRLGAEEQTASKA